MIVFDYDELARVAEPSRQRALERYHADGWLTSAHAWRPSNVRRGASVEAVRAELDRARLALGLAAIALCPHDAGPPVCWCRKPIPGSIMELAAAHGVALGSSVVVGSSAADRTMAQRLGMAFHETDAVFGS